MPVLASQVLIYWPPALLLAYMAIAVCYLRVARARGLGARVLPYALTGGALTLLFTAAWVAARLYLPTHPPRTRLGPPTRSPGWTRWCASGSASASTIVHEARRAEFGYLRTQLGLTAGNLSKHLGVLEAAGLIEVEKGYAGKRGRTWITLTAAGDTALADEIARLKLLVARVETTDPPEDR
ncbi:transcriptional regulator [Plantactinospora sp. KLBMP9567]|uniref:transcriptional regulator n=1 Tax=Plantactinospora sp. KLBMP9567 TaxID=3085900 RepID=UPI003990A424